MVEFSSKCVTLREIRLGPVAAAQLWLSGVFVAVRLSTPLAPANAGILPRARGRKDPAYHRPARFQPGGLAKSGRSKIRAEGNKVLPKRGVGGGVSVLPPQPVARPTETH